MITIVNYGMGNLGSVQNMLKRIGTPCKISSDLKEIEAAEKILLPGVGAFDAAIQKIDELSNSFIYVVSSNSITGGKSNIADAQIQYFQRIKDMQLKNPTVIGFGIKDKSTFDTACMYANGAIIGSAFVQAIDKSKDLKNDVSNFIKQIKS